MEIIRTSMEGCYELQPNVIGDTRGCFVKTYQESFFKAHALESNFSEEYYTISSKNVLRGLHFQTPPHHHAKCIFCLSGTIFDVAVDLRKDSTTFGKYYATELSSKNQKGMYMAAGFAHGFLALEDNSVIVCKTTTEYCPSHDTGVRWDSVGVRWPVMDYIISEKDQNLTDFRNWETPFR